MAFDAQQLIALKCIPNCGDKTVRNIADFMSRETVSSVGEFADAVNGCIARRIAVNLKKRISIDDAALYMDKAAQILEMQDKMGIKTVSYQDVSFPKRLLKTVNEKGALSIPVLLHYKGDLRVADMPGVAVIGTREPTAEGIHAGKLIGEMLAGNGFNVVSGLALGCDTAGHRGALSVEGGRTTAFLAHALNTVYPSENKELAEEIVSRGGLLMSEYAIGDDFNKFNFIARDRLQSSLSEATVVIQTDSRGGAMHTARTTMIYGRPIFCMEFPALKGNKATVGNELMITEGLAVPMLNQKGSIIRHAIPITLENALEKIKGKL